MSDLEIILSSHGGYWFWSISRDGKTIEDCGTSVNSPEAALTEAKIRWSCLSVQRDAGQPVITGD